MKKQLSTSQHKSKIYRKGVGIMLLNKEGKIFVGQRFDKDKSAQTFENFISPFEWEGDS